MLERSNPVAVEPARGETQVRRRVVVADDVQDIAEFVCRVLTREGFDVTIAEDGEQALQKIAEIAPDLVVLDIMLPKLHGIDVLKQIPSVAGKPIGVIVCSAKSFKPEVDQACQLGAFAFLAKPFSRAELMEKVSGYFASLDTAACAGGRASEGAVLLAEEPFIPALDLSRGYWRLWGTRGSTPIANARFLRHGGNTSCFEVRCGEEVIVIDAGSGIRELGNDLMQQPGGKKIHLFIGHTHWDHIQGFPFFAPAYVPGNEIHIYAAHGFGKELEAIFRGQLDRDYFPVDLEEMQARIRFHVLAENPVQIGRAKIFWDYTNHPGATIGFRVETPGKRMAYITDNEFLKGYLGNPVEVRGDSPLMKAFQKMVAFVAGSDLLISEAQYTNEEYVKKVGWGHSSVTNACVLAAQADVRRWLVTHHDPTHDDEFLDRKLNLTRQILANLGFRGEVAHAYDGMYEPL